MLAVGRVVLFFAVAVRSVHQEDEETDIFKFIFIMKSVCMKVQTKIFLFKLFENWHAMRLPEK